MYLRSRRQNRIATVALVLIGLGLLAGALYGCYYVVTWQDEALIIVEDRWWVAQTRVQYTDTDVKVTLDSDGNPSVSTETTTVTRCKAELTGRELPVEYPLPACKMWGGDYISHSQYFYIKYHEQESSDSAIKAIVPWLWASVEPRSEVKATWNALRVITEVENAQDR